MGTRGKGANVEHMPLGNRSRRKDILQPFRIFYSLAPYCRIEHHEGDPTRLSGSHGARQHGAGIAVQDDQAPPAVALDGKIHHAAVDKPILMGGRGFEGMRLGHGRRAMERLRAWNVRIDATVESHDALDGPHGEIVLAPEPPDAKAAG